MSLDPSYLLQRVMLSKQKQSVPWRKTTQNFPLSHAASCCQHWGYFGLKGQAGAHTRPTVTITNQTWLHTQQPEITEPTSNSLGICANKDGTKHVLSHSLSPCSGNEATKLQLTRLSSSYREFAFQDDCNAQPHNGVLAALTSGWELFCVNNFSSILLAGGLLDTAANDWKGTPGKEENKNLNDSTLIT